MSELNVMKKKDHRGKLENIFIVLIFLVATVIMIVPFLETQRILATSDWAFHASRVEQIYDNLRQGKLFTYIATTTFQHTGVGSFLFYPTLFFYPWAILRFYFNPIVSFYIWYGIVTFFTYMIGYLCMLSYSKNKMRSLSFAFIYALAPYRLYLGGFVFGEFIAATFIPLVFLGLYEIVWRDSKKWYILSIGMSLLVYSHILSVLLMVELLVVVVGILLIAKKISFLQLKALAFSALLTVLLSLPIIIPFVTDFIGHDIFSAYKGIGILINGTTLIQDSFANTSGTSIGIVLLATVVVGWHATIKGTLERYSYWLGIVLMIIATSVFPWDMFSESFIATVQLPWRYLSYSAFFLAVVASHILARSCKSWNTRTAFVVFSLILAAVGLLGYFGSVSGTTAKIKKYDQNMALKPANPNNPVQKIPQPTQLNKENYQNQFGYAVAYGETDYYPKRAQANSNYAESIVNNMVVINNKKIKIKPTAAPNYLTFNIKLDNKSRVDLPVVTYAHTYVYVDHKKVPFSKSKRATVQLELAKGKHVVTIGYAPGSLYFVGLFIAGIGWLSLAIFFTLKKYKKYFSKKTTAKARS